MNRSCRLRRLAGFVVLLGGLATTPRAVASAGAPGLALQPTQGPPNSRVAVTGSGFCTDPECGPVTVRFSGFPVATPVAVQPGGGIRAQFDVPPSPAGWQRVVAEQPQVNLSVTAMYFVTPSLPAAGPPSDGTPAPAPSTDPGSIDGPPSTEASIPTTATTGAPGPTTVAIGPGAAARRRPTAGGSRHWAMVAAATGAAIALATVVVTVARRRGTRRGRGPGDLTHGPAGRSGSGG